MRARTIAALSLLSTTVVGNVGDGTQPRTDAEAVVHILDPCVLTRTPEHACRRFLLINHGAGRTEKLRVVLTRDQREQAEAWWNRPENRWRR